MSQKTYIEILVSAILTTGLVSSTTSVFAAEKSERTASEKCYGVVKKGMNDCAGNSHPCQGQSQKDNDPGEFLYVLEGTCQKIVGGKKKE